MTAERKLNAITLSIMIVAMFFVVGALVPLVEKVEIWQKAVAAVLAMLASAGTYQLLASVLAALLRNC